MHYSQCLLPALAICLSSSAHILPVTANAIDLPAAFERGLQPRQNSAFPAGTDCAGSDGAWNCLTTAWQRCVTGNWTGLMNTAPGTMCKPVGLSFDFHVVQISDTVTSTSCASTTHSVYSTTDFSGSSTPTTPITSTTVSTQSTALASTCTSPTARSTYGSTSGELVSGGATIGSRMLVTSGVVGLLAVGFARMLM